MSFSRRKTTLGFAAGAATLALALAGCSNSSDPESSASGEPGGGETGEKITLTISTFNQFGYNGAAEGGGADYEYDLIAEYEELNPNIDVVYNVAATSNDARENFFNKLGPGGLSDIEAIELDWMPEAMQYSDLLTDLSDSALDGRWSEAKVTAATDADGRLVGYGTDLGPEAVCYNVDAFEAAGLPTDRAEVASLLDGDWETFFDVGRQYKEATGKAWYEENAVMLQGMIGQVETPYENPDDNSIIAAENADVKALFDLITEASQDGLSANLEQWQPDWQAGFAAGDFAVTMCPPWFLGIIEGYTPDGNWDMADVFPNGGGNWGGSYLVVPGTSEHPEEAKALAEWLTAPEQMVKTFTNIGQYPSAPEAQQDPAVTSYVREFFNNAPTGEIYASRAEAIEVSPYKGPHYFQVNDLLVNALRNVDNGEDPAAQWENFVSEVGNVG